MNHRFGVEWGGDVCGELGEDGHECANDSEFWEIQTLMFESDSESNFCSIQLQ